MEWIKVKDRLPEKEGEYLVYVEIFTPNEKLIIDSYNYYKTLTKFEKRIVKIVRKDNQITHFLSKDMHFLENEHDRYINVVCWAPLPEPPEPPEENRWIPRY